LKARELFLEVLTAETITITCTVFSVIMPFNEERSDVSEE
jgi:hypothetical protein